jgi:CRISPR-associated protein Cas1
MTKIGSTLFVNTPGSRVSVSGRSLTVSGKEGRSRVPMEAVEGVLLIGGANITTEAIARCAKSGIRVAALTRGGRVKFCVAPSEAGNVHLRVAQVRAIDQQRDTNETARLIVAAKLMNSRRLVQRWLWDAKADRRAGIAECVERIEDRRLKVFEARDVAHLLGIEGDAARSYFKAMRLHLDEVEAAATMMKRSRRPPADPVNAALSFGYGVVTAELVGAAQVVGLDPQVGFLHGVRSGRPALALDVLEEFRAQIVDRFVVGALRRRQLRLEHFTTTPGGGWYLSEEGRSVFLGLFDSFKESNVAHPLFGKDVPRWSLPVNQMVVLARYLRGDLPTYVPWTAG